MSEFPPIDITSGWKLAGEYKLVSYRFPTSKFQSIELIHITDTQIGSKYFMKKRLNEYIDWILSVSNRFVFLGGDIIDAATVLSVASPYENEEEPQGQAFTAVNILRPLREANRILGYVGGNHERRTGKTFGDCGTLISKLLEIPYSRGVQLFNIYFGGHEPFKVSLWHGTGCARTKGAKLQMLHRFMGQADSQLYLVGHLHDVVATYTWRQVRTRNRLKLVKVAGVMSSSFQSYWNSYAEVAALDPSDTMMARTILEPNGRWETTLR